MSKATSLYERYTAHLQKIADINGALALLHWDSETYASAKGAEFRSRQLATISALSHEYSISAEFGQLLEELHAVRHELDARQARNLERSREDYEKATKLPVSFVAEYAKAHANAFQAWIKARQAKDFGLFRDALGELVRLLRQKAELLGYEGHPYNAMLNEYEEGANVAQLDALFAQVRAELVAFAKELREAGKATNNDFLKVAYDKDKQWAFGIELLKGMGYDFEAGRQDVSEHPFTTTFSPLDVRVTTRVSVNDPLSMIGTCIHEGGHALYEQGLPADQYGLPLGAAVSLGIHESQSRLWENNVGLSRAYWSHWLSKMQAAFPEQLGSVEVETFYRAINQVAPNLIRVESDELHYHLHVLIRYELEKGLMDGSIEVKDLAELWNAKYREFMGVEVPDDKNGVLQDVHWAEGLLGYFPTYSLGSFYAAQFFAQAQKDIPNLETEIANGNTQPLLDWLRHHIHQHGRAYTSEQLCQRITGEPLNVQHFIQYARRKYSEIYALNGELVG